MREPLVQACEWTGDCPVDGCQNRCQLFPRSVGPLFQVAIDDRSYDLDSWKMCPYLAAMVYNLQVCRIHPDCLPEDNEDASIGAVFIPFKSKMQSPFSCCVALSCLGGHTLPPCIVSC